MSPISRPLPLPIFHWMYVGGYDNFVSTSGTIGATLTNHVNLNAGYQLGSRLMVKDDDSPKRIGVRLTQQGAIAGLVLSL